MPRATTKRRLVVSLNGKNVGVLSVAPTGAVSFTYAPEWLEWEHAAPVSRSIPLQRARHTGAPILAVIDNLLPDNVDIRQSVATRVGAAGHDPFSLLEKIGRDCVGALQFLPPDQEPGVVGAVEGEPQSDQEISALLQGLARAPLGVSEDDKEFRLSIAGAQEKTALTHYKNKWLKPKGATATTHIFKPPIGKLDDWVEFPNSVENEYLCLQLCKAFGLKTAQSEIIEFNGVTALVVKRFDREWTKDGRLLRLPQEDMCQALGVPSSNKYESHGGPGIVEIMNVLKESDLPNEDRAEFMRAQAVFWLLGAIDGHAKNFSLKLEFGGGFKMTPIYDVLSVEPLAAQGKIPRPKLKLSLAIGGAKSHRQLDIIEPIHFYQTADACGFMRNDLEEIFDDIVRRSAGVCADAKKMAPPTFPVRQLNAIVKAIKSRTQLLEKSLN